VRVIDGFFQQYEKKPRKKRNLWNWFFDYKRERINLRVFGAIQNSIQSFSVLAENTSDTTLKGTDESGWGRESAEGCERMVNYLSEICE